MEMGCVIQLSNLPRRERENKSDVQNDLVGKISKVMFPEIFCNYSHTRK